MYIHTKKIMFIRTTSIINSYFHKNTGIVKIMFISTFSIIKSVLMRTGKSSALPLLVL